MKRHPSTWLSMVALSAGMLSGGLAGAELPLLLVEDFADGAAERWRPADPDAWRVLRDVTGETYYSLFTDCRYEPPVRAPFNVSLLEGPIVSDFDLRLRVRSTERNYDHRDVCILFGVQDASHEYYAHLGKRPDDTSHNILVVDGAPRRAITGYRTAGIPWDDAWHDVRVARDVSSGTIEVWFDGERVLAARDMRFSWGRIGIGSFDDTADFAALRLHGRVAEATAAGNATPR